MLAEHSLKNVKICPASYPLNIVLKLFYVVKLVIGRMVSRFGHRNTHRISNVYIVQVFPDSHVSREKNSSLLHKCPNICPSTSLLPAAVDDNLCDCGFPRRSCLPMGGPVESGVQWTRDHPDRR